MHSLQAPIWIEACGRIGVALGAALCLGEADSGPASQPGGGWQAALAAFDRLSYGICLVHPRVRNVVLMK